MQPERPAVIAATPRRGEHVVIPTGTVAGIVHQARGVRDGETPVELLTHFGIFEPSDDVQPGDPLRLEGEQPIEVSAPIGYESLQPTVPRDHLQRSAGRSGGPTRIPDDVGSRRVRIGNQGARLT